MKLIAATVRYANTFLLIGGRFSDTHDLNTMIKYEPGTGGWTILNQKLKNSNAGFVRMMVKSIIFPSCAVGK